MVKPYAAGQRPETKYQRKKVIKTEQYLRCDEKAIRCYQADGLKYLLQPSAVRQSQTNEGFPPEVKWMKWSTSTIEVNPGHKIRHSKISIV